MAYPASLPLVTVFDTIIDAPGGTPAAGTVRFISSVWLNNPAVAESVAAVDRTVTLDGTGSFSVTLPANDGAGWLPAGWSYTVVLTINGKRVQGSLTLPNSPSTVGLLDNLVIGESSSGGGGGSSGPVAWSAITGKPATFPPSAHSHVQGDVTGLTTALAGKADAAAVTTALAGKSNTGHTHAQADVTSLTTDLSSLSGRVTALEGGGGGGGAPATTLARANLATGDFPVSSDGSWTPIAGLTLSLAAAVGDDVELYVGCLLDANGAATDAFEMCVVASGGGVARFGSTNTSSPNAAGPGEGDPAAYPHPAGQRFQPFSAMMSFTVAAGDLTSGNVVFGIAHKGPGGGKVFASAAYPFRWRARNDH